MWRYLIARILKTYFTLTLKRITYAFILFLLWRFCSLKLFCFGASFPLPRACICLLRGIVKFVLTSLLLLHHWFLYFFRFSYVFLLCHCSKLTVSLPRCCLDVYCALISSTLLSSLLLRRSSPPRLPSRIRLVVF